MSQTSTHLSLPYIQPAQAQKHVTHNEALRILDALVQLSVGSRALTEPPANPAEGARYIVASGATGGWAGQDHAIALYEGPGWITIPASTGWRAWVVDEGQEVVWDGSLWQANTGALPDHIGLGTAADPVNRLSIAAPATLLTHEGAGHQLKINKAVAADTASLLFQTGWSGRAEMGTTGEDGFSVKVSADGSAWFTGLRLDPATGTAEMPEGAVIDGALTGDAVTQGPSDSNGDAVIRAQDGYLKGTILAPVAKDAGGVPTGGVIERGSNANGSYVRRLCENTPSFSQMMV